MLKRRPKNPASIRKKAKQRVHVIPQRGHASVAVERDATERKRSEDALRESEQKYRALVENSPMMIGIIQDGRLKYINKAAIEELGWAYQELVSPSVDPIERIVSKNSRGLLRQNIGKRLRDEEHDPYEISLMRKDGSEVQVLVIGEKITYSHKPAIEFVLENITERKRVEERLRQSEERYRSLFDRMLDGVYLSTHEGHFVDVNPAFVRMFRYSSKQEMLEIKDIKKELYFSPEERGSHILDTGREEVEAYRMRRKDGSEIWVEDHGRYIHDADGKVIYHEGILRDATEHYRAEEALRDSEEKYRTIFNNSALGIFRSTFEGRLLEVNPAMVKMFGFDSSENMIRQIHDIAEQMYVHAEDRRRIVADHMSSSDTSQHLNHYRRRDGSEFIANLYVKTVRDTEGRPLFLEGIVEDITERKRLEDELREYSNRLEELVNERSAKLAESEARYRRLFESSPVALFEEDFSEVKKYIDDLRSRGIHDLTKYFAEHPEDLAKCASMVKIVDVNRTTLLMYGADSVDELRGELARVFTHEFQTKFTEELVALGDGETRFASEFDNQTLHGDTRHVNLLLTVVPGYEDTLAKVLVAIVDLTERKKMEEQLQQAERLAAVGETATMVGHDLRNPLQGIAGALHLLKQEPLTANERSEILQVIQKSLEYAESIVRELSDYSARIELSLSYATPKSILREALQAVKIPPSVTVEDLSKNEPTFRGDVSRLRRVFINLIENAVDAMPEGGKLILDSRQLGGSVEIVLSDTGAGMADKVAANLWKPFQTTKAKGLGLGLSISKRIVEAHGGSISVQSKIGAGTTITTCLPIQPEAGR
jgi:PAS domain S-box-containing protein